MYAQIDVRARPVDLHSGSYGGAVHNPAIALAQIIAALKGPDGRIRIPGFYDDVGRADRAGARGDRRAPVRRGGVPRDGRRAGARRRGRATRRWSARRTRPTLDVNGIWGGFQGEGTKTIIPAQAHAKVSCRLVPRQDPRRHLREARGVRRRDRAARRRRRRCARSGAAGRAVTPIDHPVTQAAARALEAGVRAGAGLHPRGRLDPGRRELRVDPGAAGRARGLHAAARAGPRPERMAGPRELRAGDPGHRRDVRRDRRRSTLPSGDGAVRMGDTGHPPGATLLSPHER